MTKTILVTGGCGFIGSHTIVLLLEQGYNVVVVDNLSNSMPVSLDRVQKIVGMGDEERKKRVIFHEVDLCDEPALRIVFEISPKFDACIHFAGLKVNQRIICSYMTTDIKLTTFVALHCGVVLFRLWEKAP